MSSGEYATGPSLSSMLDPGAGGPAEPPTATSGSSASASVASVSLAKDATGGARADASGPVAGAKSTRVTKEDQLGHLAGPYASAHSADGTPPDHSEASHAWPSSSRVAPL